MKTTKLTLIHTSAVLVPLFTELGDRLLPGVEITQVTDDTLIKQAIAHGSLCPAIVTRLQEHISQAQQSGAEAIMVTCSSMGPAIESSQAIARVPLIRVDQAMAEQAVALGRRIGVIATVSTTLGPTAALIERCAQVADRQIEVTMCLCDGALEKLLAGQVEEHDRMVQEQLGRLMEQVDVIVLAQASMSRVSDQLDHSSFSVPILSSPNLAFQKLAKELYSD